MEGVFVVQPMRPSLRSIGLDDTSLLLPFYTVTLVDGVMDVQPMTYYQQHRMDEWINLTLYLVTMWGESCPNPLDS